MIAATPREGSVLNTRQLNRSLLARQHLLDRTSMPASDVIEHLVGMQSQVPRDPFIGLWTRIADFDHTELDRLMLARETTRATLMRGTIHLVTARDAYVLRPMMQRKLEQLLAANANYSPNLAGLDVSDIVEAGRQLLDVQPMTGMQLRETLGQRWPNRDAESLAFAVRSILPLVQVTPRGTWNKSQQATFMTMEAWLGEPVAPQRDPDTVIPRYLAAFGPATAADIQTWCSLTGIREALDRIRPQLVTFRDEYKRELFDIPGAPFPDPETPAPVRFLPGFDNALLSHADRTRIIAGDVRKAIWRANGMFPAGFLVDGQFAGTWKARRTKKGAVLEITPLRQLDVASREALEGEGVDLLRFLEGSKADTFAVDIATGP